MSTDLHRRTYNQFNAVGISVRIGHSPSVCDGQFLGIDVFQNGGFPFFFIVTEDFNLVPGSLVNKGFQHGEENRKNLWR